MKKSIIVLALPLALSAGCAKTNLMCKEFIGDESVIEDPTKLDGARLQRAKECVSRLSGAAEKAKSVVDAGKDADTSLDIGR